MSTRTALAVSQLGFFAFMAWWMWLMHLDTIDLRDRAATEQTETAP